VHLVGFIIRIYHDARSPGRQIRRNECLLEALGIDEICQRFCWGNGLADKQIIRTFSHRSLQKFTRRLQT